jgi:hypothetical protein
VIKQGVNESRLSYLLRVAAIFCEQNGGSTIDYDGTTCDGYCLASELDAEQLELTETKTPDCSGALADDSVAE